MKNKNLMYVIFGLFIIFGFLFIFIKNNNNSDNDILLDEVKLNDKLIKNDKNIAVLIEKEDGSGYEESDTFPTDMVLNASLSNCIDQNGQIISEALTYNNGIVNVEVESTAYCYLYFNRDSTPPGTFTFYIGDSTNPTSINTTSTSAYLSWNDTDVAYYCVTNTEGSSNCTWQSASGTSATPSHTLTTGDGTKTVYAYLKDISGNVSDAVSDTITLDTSAPTNNSVSINSGATYTTSTSVTLTISSSGASEMCISNTTTCSSWETYATSKSWTLNNSTNGTKTVYVWFRDALGNTTSSYVSDTIILDTVAPTVTASASSTKIVFSSDEAGTYCINTTSTSTNFSNCTLSGSISANTSTTSSALTTSGTYYVHVKDSAGNVGGSSGVSITTSFCTSGTALGTCLINGNPSGLQKTYIGSDTLYRYSGTTGNTGINNYICLGTTSKCSSGSDYMYRIIGVEPSTGYVKVIKQTTYGDAIVWNSSTGVTWSSSNAFTQAKAWYNSSGLTSIIQSHSWNIGDVSSYPSTRSAVYSTESSSTYTASVGIMSLTDFYMAYNGDQSWNSSYSNYANNWIHCSNNDSNITSREWTMTRYSTNYAIYVLTTGKAMRNPVTYASHIRPTFFLKSTVKWSSGTGTASDPFIVS